jgi:hypothetical protein
MHSGELAEHGARRSSPAWEVSRAGTLPDIIESDDVRRWNLRPAAGGDGGALLLSWGVPGARFALRGPLEGSPGHKRTGHSAPDSCGEGCWRL